MTQFFLCEKYVILRDTTTFEKDAQAQDGMLFEDARLALRYRILDYLTDN